MMTRGFLGRLSLMALMVLLACSDSDQHGRAAAEQAERALSEVRQSANRAYIFLAIAAIAAYISFKYFLSVSSERDAEVRALVEKRDGLQAELNVLIVKISGDSDVVGTLRQECEECERAALLTFDTQRALEQGGS